MNRKPPTLAFVLLGLLNISTLSQAGQEVHTPPTGSSERRSIMDTLRLDAYRDDAVAAHRNSQGIFMAVHHLKVHDGWALVCAVPVNANGKEVGEVRWTLLRRQAGQWSDAHYFDALPLASEEEGLDALGMSASTIRRIWRKFPDAPKDIFPALSRQRP